MSLPGKPHRAPVGRIRPADAAGLVGKCAAVWIGSCRGIPEHAALCMGEEPVRKPPTVSGGPPRKPWLPRKFFDRLEAEHEARGTCSATATSRPAARGFTLVEMLVVIAIITILAGLVLAGVTAARRHAKEKAAESTIKRIELAATRYETDFGDYPDSGGMDGVAGCENLLEALKSTAKSGPYIEGNEFRETDSNRNGRPEIADEWGRPFRYVHHKYYKVAPNKRTYRLFSVGADGKEDTDDDIRNWDPRKPE